MHPQLQPILQNALMRLMAMAQKAADVTQESLGRDAMHAPSNADRQMLMAAQFELSRKLSAFKSTFALTLKAKVEEEVRTPTGTTERGAIHTDWSSLSLVDDRADEARVSSKQLAEELGARCDAEWRELSAYLSSMLGHEDVRMDANPVRPEVLAKALFRAIEAVTDDKVSRRVLARHVAVVMARDLGAVYTEVIAELKRRKIEPVGLAIKPAANTGATVMGGLAPATASMPLASSQAAGGGQGREDAAWQALHAFLGVARPLSFPTGMQHPDFRSTMNEAHALGGPGGGGAPMGAGSLGSGHGQGTLMNLGARIDAMARDLEALRSQAGAATSQAPIAQRIDLADAEATPIDKAIVDAVADLFDEILRDEHIPPALARQFARLQMPTLRIALADPKFFQQSTQTTRRIIDRLGTLALGHGSLDSEHGSAFLQGVTSAIDDFLKGNLAAPEHHEAMLGAVEALGGAELNSPEAQARDAVFAKKEAEMRATAAQASPLQAAVDALELPPFLAQFVAKTWPRVLARHITEQGPEGPDFLQAQQTLRDLFSSIQPKNSPQQRSDFLMKLPQLMKQLQSGMALLGLPPEAQQGFLGSLRPLHLEALKHTALGTAELLAQQAKVNALEAQLKSSLDAAQTNLGDDRLQVLPAHIEPDIADTEADAIQLIAELPTDVSGEPSALNLSFGAEPGTAANAQGWLNELTLGDPIRLQLDRGWEKVRVKQISDGRAFFVFEAAQDRVFTLTAGMIVRLKEWKRIESIETESLMERASKRVREANWR